MYEIDQETIRFSNGKRYKFQGAIAEILEFEESIVVRLADAHAILIHNIFALDYRGNLLWKVPAPRTFEPRNPYVSLFRRGGFLEVLNWDGHLLTLNPKQGNILSEDFYAGGPSLHRTGSRRSWM